MTRYEEEKQRMYKLKNLKNSWYDSFENILEAILRMNVKWSDNTPLTEADIFTVLFMHTVSEKDLDILAEYKETFNTTYESIRSVLDWSNVKVFIPELKEFRAKYLLSDFKSDRIDVSSILAFMKENYGTTLIESENYVKEVESVAKDLLLIKTVQSLSRSDLIDFNVELSSIITNGEGEVSLKEKMLNEREQALISKYKGTGLDYRYDKEYYQIVEERTALYDKKEEIKAKKQSDYEEFSSLPTEKLQEKLIMNLCSAAIQNKKQIEAYLVERKLNDLGLGVLTKENLSFIVDIQKRLNSLVSKKEQIEKALDRIETFFDDSKELQDLRDTFILLLSTRAELIKAGDDYNMFGDIIKEKSKEYHQIEKMSISKRKKRKLLEKKGREIKAASFEESEAHDKYMNTNIKLFSIKNDVLRKWTSIKKVINPLVFNQVFSPLYESIDNILRCESLEDFDAFMDTKEDIAIDILCRTLEKTSKEIESLEDKMYFILCRVNMKPDSSNYFSVTYINDSIKTILSHESEIELVRSTEFTISKSVIEDADGLVGDDPQTGKEVITAKIKSLKYKD